MTQDLEASILRFLKETPRKRFITVREIALAVTGKYPAARQEKYVREICMALWEIHILDEDKVPRQTGFRLKQKGSRNFSGRIALKDRYKKDIVILLKKTGE